MNTSRATWRNTTHDWASTVDLGHLEHIRRQPAVFAPGGCLHLILEVVAYAADEAASVNGGACRITLQPDGSVTVADDGRGTDTRVDEHGRIVRKPVMATKDLRFFDRPDAPVLPDGHPRRGMSVVAALSTWLVHTNRRRSGSWTQRYEYGVPTTDLQPIADEVTGTTAASGTTTATGTTVRFLPGEPSRTAHGIAVDALARQVRAWPHLCVGIDDRRGAA
ncbi:ATP-binding protein [Streptomyces sp. KLOTTS4A1]|uniref:ATP-binding protein n=1 Tax=Streptomyces sp. KLOTTS4A1 TaxID=3390996 RepID=UPI0039F5946F